MVLNYFFVFFISIAFLSKVSADILLQSATSVESSGLYSYLLPKFKAQTGISVRVVSAGTGQVLRNAANGDGDILIVHSKEDEIKFIEAGFGILRKDLMYNDFVFIAPKDTKALFSKEKKISDLMRKIAERKLKFLSRGDDSGTHKKEMGLWKSAALSASEFSRDWYIETGSGMGSTLNVAVGLGGITMTDRATWLSYRNKKNFDIIFEDSNALFNQYGIVVVTERVGKNARFQKTMLLFKWLTEGAGRQLISDYNINGIKLFYPN